MRNLNPAAWIASTLGAALLCPGPARPAPPARSLPALARNQALVLSGAAQWSPQRGVPSPLRPGRPLSFSPGDTLRCGPHSRLRIRLSGSLFPVDNPEDTWQDWPIPTSRVTGPGLYLPILGRSRGGIETRPDPVEASTFLISWTPPARGGRIALRLSAPDRRILWMQGGVDAATGCLFSAAARRALSDYQASGGAAPVLLTILQNGQTLQGIRFTLRPPP